MRKSAGGREGLTPELEARLRRADPTAHEFVEFRAVTAQHVKQTPGHWQNADDDSGFAITDDGVVRLTDGTDVLVSHASGSTQHTGLGVLELGGNGVDPYFMVKVEWTGTDSADIELRLCTFRLHPRANSAQTKNIAFWRLRTYALEEVVWERPATGTEPYSHVIRVREIADPIDVAAAGEAEGNVTFTYPAESRPRPKGIIPENPRGLYGIVPVTYFRITAHKSNGDGADNVALIYDNGTASTGSGPVLSSRDLRFGADDGYPNRNTMEDFGSGGGTPRASIEAGSYTSDDLEFTHPGNWLDLNSELPNLVTFPDEIDEATGWSQFQTTVNDDAVAFPWDGSIFADQLIEDTNPNSHSTTSPPGTGPAFLITPGERIRVEVTVKAVGSRHVQLACVTNDPISFFAKVNLSTGAVQSSGNGASGGDVLSTVVTSLGSSWYHVAVEGTVEQKSFAYFHVNILDSGFNTSYTGDGASGLYLWRAKFIRSPRTLPAASELVLSLRGADSGGSLQGQVRNDAGSDWVDFDDGDSFADLSLTATIVRPARIRFITDGGGTRSPHATYLAMEDVETIEAWQVAEVESFSAGVDPIECKGEIAELRIRAIKDGYRDYRSLIEDLLSNYFLKDITARVWVGDRALGKDKWHHKGDYPVTDMIPGDPAVTVVCLSPLVLVRDFLPPFSPGERLVPEDEPGGVDYTTNWTNADATSTHMEDSVQGEEPSQDTYVQSPLDPTNERIQFRLSVPQLDTTGRRIIAEYQFRKNASGGEQITLTARLKQGSTIVGSNIHTNIGSDWEGASFELSDAEILLMTNSADWRIEFNANGDANTPTRRAQVSWCQGRTGGKREAVAYDNEPIETVIDDLVINRLEVPERYRGPKGSLIGATGHVVSKELFPATARLFDRENITSKTDLDALFFLVGAALIESQGRLKGIDLFTSKRADVVFHENEITILSTSPGFEAAIPDYFMPYDYSEARGGFEAEARGLSGAKENLPLGRLGAGNGLRVCEEEVAKWVHDQELADEVAERMATYFGAGFITIDFECAFAHPELECGDLVSIPIDQLAVRDPLTGASLRGKLRALGVIIKEYDVMGYRFRAWVRSFSDFVGVKQEASTIGDIPAGTDNYSARVSISSAAQTIPNNTATAVGWGVGASTGIILQAQSPAGFRFYFPIGVSRGRWRFTAIIAWSSNATGSRTIELRRNGSGSPDFLAQIAPVNGSTTFQQFSAVVDDIADDDYFEFFVTQTSGGDLTIVGAAGNQSSAYVERG